MILLYNSFCLFTISYGIEIWGNTYKSNINIFMLLQQQKIIIIINKKILNLNQLPLIILSKPFERALILSYTSELFSRNITLN